MPASPLDSTLYGTLFGDPELQKLVTDTAEIRAMLIALGALAKVQGGLGLIPDTAAEAIHRASLDVVIDPGALAAATGENAVPVPALVAEFRKAMEAPEHAAFVHWGATSQDIIETGLALRLRQALAIIEARLTATIRGLGQLAEAHANLPMAGRTYGQVAVPTSFGAVVTSWGLPLLDLREDLKILRPRILAVSLAGAAGTLSAMGGKGAEVRAGLAQALDLADPEGSRHSARHPWAGLSAWLAQVAGALGKMGEDLILMTQSGIDEVSLGVSGASSTMPQKANPVAPSLLSALARQAIGLNSVMQGASLHRQQRDSAAWIAEWLSLPQIVLCTARALAIAESLTATITPRPERMAANLDGGTGAIFAEVLTFALAERMSRPDAQTAVKALAREAIASGAHLRDLALRDHPGLDTALFDPSQSMGLAPAEARAFAARALA